MTTPAPAAPTRETREIKIVSHSNLFYWWPVWAAGFLMAAITWFDGHLMAVVPNHSKTVQARSIVPESGDTINNRIAIVLPEKAKFEEDPKLHATARKGIGVIFVTVLLLVIVITNVPLRGMWSILVIVGCLTIALIFQLLGWWEAILANLYLLDIRINMGGYLFISLILLLIWCMTVFFFDRRIYIVFTPRQFKVCNEVGGGEKVFDAMGMTMEKQQSDFFRHKIIGLGAGDLVVKTAGAQSQHFDLPNVLFINNKVQAIETLMGKQVVENK
jgi:hypothetical protein